MVPDNADLCSTKIEMPPGFTVRICLPPMRKKNWPPWPGWGWHLNFDPPQCLGPRPKILDRYISLSCLRWLPTACHERLAYFHWPQWVTWLVRWWVTWSRSPDAARHIGKFSQPCYGFLGLLKFFCSQTLPNLVNCFLIIFSLVWHPKDFAQIKITNGRNASNPSNRSAVVKNVSLALFNIPPLKTPWQSSELCALDTWNVY